MRKLVVISLVALAVPAAAFARGRDQGDGTLVIKSASATIQVIAKGSILGRMDSGTMTITDWNPKDASEPQVYGAEKTISRTDRTTVYRGKNIRFKFVSGRYTIQIVGSGIDLAAVGSGIVRLTGEGTLADGQYALDGEPFRNVAETLSVDGFGRQAPTTSPAPAGA